MAGPTFIDLRDYGTPGPDIVAGFNKALADAISNNLREIYVAPGTWNFASPPANINSGIRVFGSTASECILSAQFNSSNFLTFDGIGGMSGGLNALQLATGSSMNPGNAITLIASATNSPDFTVFEDVIVTCDNADTGTWGTALSVDGTQRITPQGVRDVAIRNFTSFATRAYSANLQNIVGFDVDGFHAFPAGGTAADFYIGGGSDTNEFDAMNVLGTLIINNSQNGKFDGKINALSTASSGSHWRITGLSQSGPINSSNLTNSFVQLN